MLDDVDLEAKAFLLDLIREVRRLCAIPRPQKVQWELEGDVVNVVWGPTLQAEIYKDGRDAPVAYVAVPGSHRVFQTPRGAAEALLSLMGDSPLRVGASMPDLRQSLIRLAAANPGLRPHILAALKEGYSKTARGIALDAPNVMLAYIDPDRNNSKFYEMNIVPTGEESDAKKSAEHPQRGVPISWVLQRRWGRLTDPGTRKRIDSYNDYYSNMADARMALRHLQEEKMRKGYQDYTRQGEYPVGLGSAGFGWGGQAVCQIIPEVRAFRNELDRVEAYLKNLQEKVAPIARQNSTMGRKLRDLVEELQAAISNTEAYLDQQMSPCER